MDTAPDFPTNSEERRRRERKIWRRGLVLSVALHALVFLVWQTQGPLVSPFAAAGPRAGDDRAAAGSMQALNMRVPPRVPLTPPPIPLPTIEPVEPVEFEEDVEPVEAGAMMGELDGPEGPGLEDGEGEGDGGTSAEGLFRLVPPNPRGIIWPPEHDALKGKDVEVWVFVDVTGRVVADSTRLRPPTSNRDLDRRLIREAAEWVFEPARQGGEVVAAWFPYRISR